MEFTREQDDVQATRLRQRLAAALALQNKAPNADTGIVDGIGKLALALRNRGSQGQLDAINDRERTRDIEAAQAGNIFDVRDPQLQRLAATLAGQRSKPRPTAKDATGRVRFVDDGSLAFADVDTSGLVSPKDQFDQNARAQELRARDLGLKEDANNRQATKISAASEKAMIGFQDQAISSGRARFELESLADNFEARADEISAGAFATSGEALKSIVGSQDAETLLRKQYASLRSSQAVKNLPPGVASDKDIALALEGFLPTNADPIAIASFLRGMAKLSAFDESFSRFAAGHIDSQSSARGLLKAWDESAEKAEAESLLSSQDSASVDQDSPPGEGDVISNAAGDELIFRSGQWVPNA
ncbi:MAG: hypothetical protein ACPG6R_11925 [Aequoribacter sp.]|uniref:hypothetical protein n=1 Tax=Aequoribacter sp. TaxID=2847771 RepID=UPI003C55E03A